MLWTLIFISLYSLGRMLSRQELKEILTRTTPTTGPKRKNTYIIKPAFFHKLKFLQKCKNIPVRIVSINGQTVKKPFHSLILPGDAAHKIATTNPTQVTYQITEYLDKYTLEPVLMLLPNKQILPIKSTTDTFDRLNHASRRDLLRRIQKQK